MPPSNKCRTIGVPLRENIIKYEGERARKILNFDSRPVILCFGGSQGASFINAAAVELFRELEGSCQIIHLTGKREYFKIARLYNKIKEGNKFIRDFYYSMDVLYNSADMVISRAGASALAEISFYGLPSLLVPYPGDSHQVKNALYFGKRGAAFVLTQGAFSFNKFKRLAARLLYDGKLREEMSENLKNIRLGVNGGGFFPKMAAVKRDE